MKPTTKVKTSAYNILTSALCRTARYSALLLALLSPAGAQDIRGLEVCTAEKQIERRTSCLQANVEFLQQALARLARDTQDKIASASRDLGAARAEIDALKSTIENLKSELAGLKAKVEASAKK